MPLQSPNFVVLGLGMRSDSPPDPQPPLVDGVHLRWSFNPALGFPWHGVYVYRREHRRGTPVCIGDQLRQLKPQTWPGAQLDFTAGTFTSDAPLELTDDFASAGFAELDLRHRKYLDYTLRPVFLAYRAEVKIGLRGKPRRQCVSFPGVIGRAADLLERIGVKLQAFDRRKRLLPKLDILDGVLSLGPLTRLDIDEGVERVELVFAGDADAVDVKAEGRGVEVTRTRERGVQRVSLAGREIKTVSIAAGLRALLREICIQRRGVTAVGDSVVVHAMNGDVKVASATASGPAGSIVDVALDAWAINCIRIDGGNAALVDICVHRIADGATQGWRPLSGKWPLGLPITHPDYPATGNAAVDLPQAKTRALDRITYGSPASWSGAFHEFHDALVDLVDGGPGGPTMASKKIPAQVAVPVPPDPGVKPPTLKEQAIQDLVLLGSLHAAMAQMLGLYYVDRSAEGDTAYDYLVVADYNGVGGGNPVLMLQHLIQFGFGSVWASIAFNLRAETPDPLAPPAGAKAYALPGGSFAAHAGQLTNAPNNAGLVWDLGYISGSILHTRAPVMFHVMRTDLGTGNDPDASGPDSWLTKESPVVVATPQLGGETPVRLDDWPPFPLHWIDRGLPDGWYRYNITGVDLFGRFSLPGPDAPWRQWSPAPDPRPWYYTDPPSDVVIHPGAVRLLDKTIPPPPVAVEAWALAPDDPLIVRDAKFQTWFGTLSAAEKQNIVGLRVRWVWGVKQQRQAPMVREFRLYFQPGLPNVLSGRVTAVTPAGATSVIDTDIPNTQPASAFIGTALRIGSDAFIVVDSAATTPLRLTVRNLGAHHATGTAAVTAGSAVVDGTGTAWHAGLTGLRFRAGADARSYTILSIESATRLTLTETYAGATAAGSVYEIFDLRPAAGSPCTIVIPPTYAAGSVHVEDGSTAVTGSSTAWNASFVGARIRLEGSTRRFRIAAVGSATQLTLDQPYDGLTGSARVYAIAFPLYIDYAETHHWQRRLYVVGYNQHVTVDADQTRRYELFLPAVGDADRAGLPMTTTLDEPVVYALIGVSAADQQLHTQDDPKWTGTPFGNRPGNQGRTGQRPQIFRVRREPPPPPDPPVAGPRIYATRADYHGHSFFTFRWRALPSLRGNVYRALDDALFAVDWLLVPGRTDLAAGQAEYFPSGDPRWDAQLRAQVADDINHLKTFPRTAAGLASALQYYRSLPDDALRVLAALPGNEKAFLLLNTIPLDPADPANADRRGPDDPESYVPSAALRAYIDTLDGRATNRYLYRAAYVDSAGNTGPLGLANSPVWLPDVVPPRAPVVTRITGGEREITIAWASNREPDLASYTIHRGDHEGQTRDLRLMTIVHTVAVPAGDPALRPAELTSTDTVPGARTFFYRLTAVDADGNESEPSVTVSGRGFDDELPVPPIPAAVWQDQSGVVRAEVSWTSADETMLQRRVGAVWVELASWRPPGAYTIRDPFSDPAEAVSYRIWSRKYTGAIQRGAPVTLAPP